MKRLAVLLTSLGMTLPGLVASGGLPAYATTPGENGLVAFSLDRGWGGERSSRSRPTAPTSAG
jgi:hypothetical protein